MMKQRFGRIIGITSVVGVVGNPGQGNYAASKAGLIGMSKALAHEVASRNITVNTIAPGYIGSAMTDELTDKQKEAMLSKIPAGGLAPAAKSRRRRCFSRPTRPPTSPAHPQRERRNADDVGGFAQAPPKYGKCRRSVLTPAR